MKKNFLEIWCLNKYLSRIMHSTLYAWGTKQFDSF